MKTYLALIAIDLKLAARLRVVIFFNYLLPLIVFFAFIRVFGRVRSTAVTELVLTMSVSMGILGNGLFGAGMRAVQEREMNILRRYKVTPITPAPLLAASMVTGWAIFMPYIVLVFSLAHIVYKMPWPEHMALLLVFISVGLFAFRSIGLVIASVANSMQEGMILVQVFYFPMLFLSGATIPIDPSMGWMWTVSRFIPASYLVSGIRVIMNADGAPIDVWKNFGSLLITIAVGLFVGIKLFRWEKEEKIKSSAKLWIAAILLPFLALGLAQLYHK